MMKIVKKTTAVLVTAAALGLSVTACGSSNEPASATSGTTGAAGMETTKAAEPQVYEELPESEEYTSVDGTYKVTLLKGLEQTDMQLQSNSSMMGLDGGSVRGGFSALSLGSPKGSVPGNGKIWKRKLRRVPGHVWPEAAKPQSTAPPVWHMVILQKPVTDTIL